MQNMNIRGLLNRMNSVCTRALEGAAGVCVSRTHYEVTVEHLFAKLLEERRCDVDVIFERFKADPAEVRWSLDEYMEQLPTGNSGKPVFSPLLISWCRDAWFVATIELSREQIRSGALLAALLACPPRYAAGKFVQLLACVPGDALLKQFAEIVRSSVEEPADEAGSTRAETSTGGTGVLARFCTDFTSKAKRGEVDPVFGRDREISAMIDILARRRKNNPIVVGEAGVGKTAVVEGLALRIVERDVPDFLCDVSILGLDMGLLQAGAGIRGEFENRLKSVIAEVKASPSPIILFIDEAHVLIGAGGQAGGGDAANLLKPALARGELRTIAATTWSEYNKYFEKDAALARRFQPVKLDEPSVETTALILRGLRDKYEQAHGVTVRDDAISAAAELAGRYLSGRQLPDKAVDLLDTSAARVKVMLTARPGVVEDRERSIRALRRTVLALDRDRLHGRAVDEHRLRELNERIALLQNELKEAAGRWERERELAHRLIELRREFLHMSEEERSTEHGALVNAKMVEADEELKLLQEGAPLVRVEVDPDVVAKVVSDWTGIPLGKVLRDQARDVMRLEEALRRRIKGQDDALHAICETLRAAKAETSGDVLALLR
jgi:type VI secretion system protein VasG